MIALQVFFEKSKKKSDDRTVKHKTTDDIDGFRARIHQLSDAVGSLRKLALWFRLSSPTVLSWTKDTAPYYRNLEKVCQNTGLNLDWLSKGVGDANIAIEMAKNWAKNTHDVPSVLIANIRNEMEKSGDTERSLADKTGYSQSYIRAVLEGRARASEGFIRAVISAYPSLDMDDFMLSGDHPIVLSTSAADGTYGAKPKLTLPPGSKARYVPLLSMAQAGEYNIAHSDESYSYEAVLAMDVDDARAFALKIDGDSMYPTIQPGDRVIIAPSWQCRINDIVVVKTREGDVYCKLYAKRSGDVVWLHSLNITHAHISLSDQQISWMYPVAQIMHTLRRD
jgi:SOS-response transcriptional repressor LexA